MKKFISAIILILVVASSVQAYEFKEPNSYDIIDSQTWYYSKAGDSKLATGLCFGPLLEFVNKNKVRVGEVFRGCTMLSYDGLKDTNSDQISGGFGVNFISLMGVTGSVIRDPFESEWKFGLGFSLTQIYSAVSGTKQLETSPEANDTHPISFLSDNKELGHEEVGSLVDRLSLNLVSFN